MVSMGLVADTVLGADAAGTIKRVGSKVTLVEPGDRVALMCLGAYRNLLRVDETVVQVMPENMTFEEGASLPCVYITAYQSLVEIGRLSHGESILIHSAAGGEYFELFPFFSITLQVGWITVHSYPSRYKFPAFLQISE